MALVITYDNESLQDGLGSQALRILGIYSVAKLLGIHYQHTPIMAFEEEYSHGMKEENAESNLLDQVNDFFCFPSKTRKTQVEEVLRKREIGFLALLRLRLRFLFTKKTVLLRLLLPFNITDRIPWVYSAGIYYLRRRNQDALVPKDIYVVHVRRGYGYLTMNPAFFRPRHLPYDYYSAALGVIANRFFHDKQLKIIVHTDLSPIDIKWKPFQERQVAAAKKSLGVEGKFEGLLLPGIDLKERIKFPENALVEIEYCSSFMKTFLDMSNCKVLIQSKSSLSYLAGLLNRGIVIWPNSHGHARYPLWKNSLKLGLRQEDFRPLIEGRPDR